MMTSRRRYQILMQKKKVKNRNKGKWKAPLIDNPGSCPFLFEKSVLFCLLFFSYLMLDGSFLFARNERERESALRAFGASVDMETPTKNQIGTPVSDSKANKKTRNRAYAGADIEFTIKTKKGQESRPLHLAARLGCLPILKQSISHGCKINARTETGDTAVMLATRANQTDCFLELIIAVAHLGLVNNDGDSAVQLAKRSVFGSLCGQHYPPGN